jgi:hypothetical protein
VRNEVILLYLIIYWNEDASWAIIDVRSYVIISNLLYFVISMLRNSSMHAQKFSSVTLRTLACRTDYIFGVINSGFRFLLVKLKKKKHYIRRFLCYLMPLLILYINLQPVMILAPVITNIILAETF